MLAVDGSGIPLNLLTEAAKISEYRLALQTIDGISVAIDHSIPEQDQTCS